MSAQQVVTIDSRTSHPTTSVVPCPSTVGQFTGPSVPGLYAAIDGTFPLAEKRTCYKRGVKLAPIGPRPLLAGYHLPERKEVRPSPLKRVGVRIVNCFSGAKVLVCPRFLEMTLESDEGSCALDLDTTRSVQDELVRHGVVDHYNWWFMYNGRPVRLNLIGETQGFQRGGTIVAHRKLRGGQRMNVCLPTYGIVAQCERQLLMSDFVLQAEDEEESAEFVAVMMSKMSLLRESLCDCEKVAEHLENFFQIAYWFRKCSSAADYAVCVSLAYKLVMGRGVTASFMRLFGATNNLQGAFDDGVQAARKFFDLSTSALSNPLVARLRKLYTYLLVQGFLKQVGRELSDEEFLLLDKKTRVEYSSQTGLLTLVVDTAITICERISAYRVTGDWMSLVHTEAAYSAWFREADRLLGLGNFTSNLEALGTTYFAFTSDLNASIEKGEAYVRFMKKSNLPEMSAMNKKLCNLKLLKNLDLTKRAAQKERKAPFGVLLYGGSSVAKSTFTKAMFYYYGKLHGLDVDDHYMFARSPMDEYWSNFDPSMWCIRMDDIALLDPTKCPEVDPTVRDIINVINNVPYIPPQAAVEDKGKTPVMAKLVLATSNVPHLNAAEFFSCPLAVRRRLPFVVHIRPKEEFAAENKLFIDPKKLPPIDEKFPDYWEITLQEVEPLMHRNKTDAKLKTIKVFTSMEEFLREFAKATVQHEQHQAKATLCDQQMKDLTVCRLCYSVGKCDCLQADVTIPGLVLWWFRMCLVEWLGNFFVNFMLNMLSWGCMYYIARLRITGWFMMEVGNLLDAKAQIRIRGFFFENGEDRVYSVSFRQFLKGLRAVTSLYITYRASKYAWEWTFGETKPAPPRPTPPPPKEEVENCEVVELPDDPLETQGNVFGTTEAQMRKEEAQNVWYNPTIELNRFDVPLAAQSLTGATPETIRDRLADNCVRLSVRALDVSRTVRVCGVFVKGHWLMFNHHACSKGTKFEIEIQNMTNSQGLTSNTRVRVDISDLHVLPGRDIVLVNVRDVPPRKDITGLWATTAIPVSKIVSVRRDRDGCVSYSCVHAVTYDDAFPVEALQHDLALYLGKSDTETSIGDCGSLAVAITPKGPVIVGVHTLGYQHTAGFTYIPKSEIDRVLEEELVVTCGHPPKLDLQGSIRLTEPHHRSLMRYIAEGTLNVYGSMPGFRPKPKSRVCATPLQSEMLEHLQTTVQHCAPEMNGFAPWRNNVVEMVRPNHDIDPSILRSCVNAFTTSIVAELSNAHGDEWKKEVLFLSKRAAVNGLPGVKFIDRINVNTSMGAPFNTTKKKYLVAAVSEDYPDGVDFTPEVWEMYDEICSAYERGERCHPVFMGHLKDEAVTLAKAEAQKTRLFTGAPAAWSLVVRSRLLSFVRLVQQNSFVFEAGPGTVAQSTAWGNIREYLVQHGEDRIVAGDYSKFDKRMIARFVLAAFDVIIAVYRKAGFDDNELLQLQCIAEDTAFPLVNVNGDVVEFFGTNPSGHPLTVIINSIVNSLYMRYAYILANPEQECVTFRENVSLFTYGDDNIMGVSPACEWFNHTAIQSKLATIGVQYTMADKEADSVPFIHIDTCQFLKRSWRLDEDVGAYLCPLELESIHKMLTVWVPSGTLSPEAQMIDVISSANSEFFFYGREEFEKHHAFFKKMLALSPYCHYVREGTLPGWESLKQRFWKASKGE